MATLRGKRRKRKRRVEKQQQWNRRIEKVCKIHGRHMDSAGYKCNRHIRKSSFYETSTCSVYSKPLSHFLLNPSAPQFLLRLSSFTPSCSRVKNQHAHCCQTKSILTLAIEVCEPWLPSSAAVTNASDLLFKYGHTVLYLLLGRVFDPV